MPPTTPEPPGAPGDERTDEEADDEIERSARNEAREQAASPTAATVGPDEPPPGHPAQADDALSVGETLSDPDDLPGETGRPGRSGEADTAR